MQVSRYEPYHIFINMSGTLDLSRDGKFARVRPHWWGESGGVDWVAQSDAMGSRRLNGGLSPSRSKINIVYLRI